MNVDVITILHVSPVEILLMFLNCFATFTIFFKRIYDLLQLVCNLNITKQK